MENIFLKIARRASGNHHPGYTQQDEVFKYPFSFEYPQGHNSGTA